MSALSTGKEYEELFKGDKADAGLAKAESRILAEGQLTPLAGGLSLKDKEISRGPRVRAARERRSRCSGPTSAASTSTTPSSTAPSSPSPRSPTRSTRPSTASPSRTCNTGPLLASFHASQLLVQALPPKSSPLLQRRISRPASSRPSRATRASAPACRNSWTVPMPSAARWLLARISSPRSSTRRSSASASSSLPPRRKGLLQGDRRALHHPVVSGHPRRQGPLCPPRSENVPPIDPVDLEDVDPAEDDLDALAGRKTTKLVGKDEKTGKPVYETAETELVAAPLTAAPYFARTSARAGTCS